jgi:urease accessory protein
MTIITETSTFEGTKVVANPMGDTSNQPARQSALPGSVAPELLVWLSPAFPTGAFAYSQGLETAVTLGWVRDSAHLKEWIAVAVSDGAIGNDLMLASLAMRADTADELRDLGALGMALQTGAERYNETAVLAGNFRDAVCAGWPELSDTLAVVEDGHPKTLPVLLGALVRARGIAPPDALVAFGHAAVGHALSAAIRLSVIGQVAAQKIHAEQFPVIEAAAARALECEEADIGSVTLAADIASLMHETQPVRLFRS